jgi:hypothetical protein
MNRRRDTVEQVVIPFSDADPAVSRKRNPLRALRLHTRAFRGGPDPGVPYDPPGDVSRCRGLKRDTPRSRILNASGRVGGQVRRDRPGRQAGVSP